jgi:hypothetical protein
MQIVPAEIPHISLRDKSTMLSWSVSNICNFVASFTLPYLLSAPYANLESKVAFIYGALSIVFIVWAYFYLPDLAGRSLEEIDELFEARVPAWRSRGKISTGFHGKSHIAKQQQNGCRLVATLCSPRWRIRRKLVRYQISLMGSRMSKLKPKKQPPQTVSVQIRLGHDISAKSIGLHYGELLARNL